MLHDEVMAPARALRRYVWAIAAAWTSIVLVSLAWNAARMDQEMLDSARIQADNAYRKDILYRRWNAQHGGVYVPVTAETQPNPYLNVPEREITTPSGRELTLMNPAYMTRQVYELAEKDQSLRGHLTSLNPIRPENAADPWETRALQAFERGEQEAIALVEMDGQEYLRLMRPFLTEESCLKCHAAQGYRVGDIRGGISVSVPLAPLRAVEYHNIALLILAHAGLGLTGLGGLSLGARRLLRSERARSQAERELRAAQEDWERTFDAVPDLIAILDRNYRIVRVNRAMAERLRQTPPACVGAHCYEVVHGAAAPPPFCPHAQLLQDGQAHAAEVHEDRLGGDFVVTTSPIHDAEGQLVGCVHVAHDITARKQAEETLRETKQYLENVINSITDPVFVKDREHRLVLVNDAECALVGRTRAEMLGRTDYDFFPQEQVDGFWAQDEIVFETGQEVITEEQVTDAQGRLRTVATKKTRYTDRAGHEFVVGVARDITDRKQAEEQLQRYAAELERSNQDLQHFAYVVSHDLNEPLRMVTSYLKLLEQRYTGQLDDKAREFIAIAVDGAARMQTMIKGILDLSRVTTRGRELAPTDCEALLARVLHTLQFTIQDTGAVITHDPLPTVLADEAQLAQVFQNLLANALKFRRPDEPPRIHIAAQWRKEEGGRKAEGGRRKEEGGRMKDESPTPHSEIRLPHSEWLFSVRDNGIGIDPAQAGRLFQLFQRLHPRDEYPGAGIGLALCRKIVERHGGRIWVESQPGPGATFYFTIPDA